MKKLIIILFLALCFPVWANAYTVTGKGTNFINVILDGTNDFDLCTYLNTKGVILYDIWQGAYTNGTLTVRDNDRSAIYGQFIDVSVSGLNRYYIGRSVKPTIKASEGTAGMLVGFEVEYVSP